MLIVYVILNRKKLTIKTVLKDKLPKHNEKALKVYQIVAIVTQKELWIKSMFGLIKPEGSKGSKVPTIVTCNCSGSLVKVKLG